jgi:hypothetical protein
VRGPGWLGIGAFSVIAAVVSAAGLDQYLKRCHSDIVDPYFLSILHPQQCVSNALNNKNVGNLAD